MWPCERVLGLCLAVDLLGHGINLMLHHMPLPCRSRVITASDTVYDLVDISAGICIKLLRAKIATYRYGH
uniref:Uncharacterized protein n=1 Tax=Arundo donax TaxID=35708 RepID=A0A0A9EW38_ARUDO